MSEQGFDIVFSRDIADIKSEATLYRHKRTGAQVLSMCNDDANKVFGITFRTPPKDSTGVAHILEHSVLCGSRKYPVKEPFVELLKGSLKTFLNAFTYPDKTCYPVASQNVQDFYNLIDVYLDAVFFPRLTPQTLMQEGWHFEADGVEGPLTFQGVVYGEMKGVYSSPDSLLAEYSQQSLFPDTTYGFDSGGNPKEIPNLTFEQFQAFHQQYYHPGNARIFFWGDDDPKQRLRLVEAYLREFEPREICSEVALQKPFSAPVSMVKPYAASESGQEHRGMMTLNWMLGEGGDAELTLALQILNHALLGNPAAPLYKALIDSGLGEDLTGGGLETDLRQMTFSIGLKGIREDAGEDVQRVIFDVLTQLSRDGIDKELLRASLHFVEFHLREANTGSYPRGLIYMLKALRTWLYDGDPLALLAFEQPLRRVKELAETDGYFEGLIRKYLLDNQHRTLVLLVPDADEGARREADERDRLKKTFESMSSEDVTRVMDEAETLKRRQQAADSPEDLASIPSLSVADLPRKNKVIPDEHQTINDSKVPFYFHDLNTFGIAYLDLAFDLRSIGEQDLTLLPLLSRALLETGTDKQDFVSLSRRISANTGGIGAYIYGATAAEKKTAAKFMIRGKSVLDKVGELTSIVADVVQGARLDDRERVRQLLLEDKSQLEEGLIPGGHSVIDGRLRSWMSQAAWLMEQISGIDYLLTVREWIANFDEKWPNLRDRLRRLQRNLFTKSNVLVNVTVSQSGLEQVRGAVGQFVAGLSAGSVADSRGRDSETEPSWNWKRTAVNEGFVVPSQVQYVGKAGNVFDFGYRFHGSALVITRFLRTGWLWDRVRVQGGAYGAFCRLNRLSGVMSLLSYRDPNLERTLETYDKTAQHLQQLDLSQHEIDRNILGVIGDLDAYMLPDAMGYAAMARRITGQTPAMLDELRAQVFETRLEHFREFAEVMQVFAERAVVGVVGGQEAIDRSASALKLRTMALL